MCVAHSRTEACSTGKGRRAPYFLLHLQNFGQHRDGAALEAENVTHEHEWLLCFCSLLGCGRE